MYGINRHTVPPARVVFNARFVPSTYAGRAESRTLGDGAVEEGEVRRLFRCVFFILSPWYCVMI